MTFYEKIFGPILIFDEYIVYHIMKRDRKLENCGKTAHIIITRTQ